MSTTRGVGGPKLSSTPSSRVTTRRFMPAGVFRMPGTSTGGTSGGGRPGSSTTGGTGTTTTSGGSLASTVGTGAVLATLLTATR
ncbi:hypothetical protein [Streptomyces sp. NPDC059861]|uniref:hypothetical protein n=1 Tax=Streptomyces sp. NPDC059861 TaxID=3346974 RepID=UPI00365E5A9D